MNGPNRRSSERTPLHVQDVSDWGYGRNGPRVAALLFMRARSRASIRLGVGKERRRRMHFACFGEVILIVVTIMFADFGWSRVASLTASTIAISLTASSRL